MADLLTHYDVMLRPDPSRTVVRPFMPEYPGRFATADHARPRAILERILALDEVALQDEIVNVSNSLDERHRDVDAMLLDRFDKMKALLDAPDGLDRDRRRLIGAYFSEEYSFESAALFNPSVVLHSDQTGLAEGAVRIVVSLRGIGEGHVSSVSFRVGTWTPGGALDIDPPSAVSVPPNIEGAIPDNETEAVKLNCAGAESIAEVVLFPSLPSQRQGIEDLRLVRFTEDDGSVIYRGTYTAFSGADARPEMLSGNSFREFEMRPLTGDASGAKGMALFPRRIGGRYAMLGRQDSENIWLHMSDTLHHWEGGEILVRPQAPWEFMQIGNCGSPIEIEEGWLVLTHGVGTVRNYCMGACLLDKDDPSKLLARTPLPILQPSPEERDGYVPNVVYSCGGLVLDRRLLLPYGVADNFTGFATVPLDDLLAAMR